MISRRRHQSILALVVLICFGQQCRLALVAAQQCDLLAGDEIVGCQEGAAGSCRTGPQEAGAGTKTMNQEPIQRRVRVYRVFSRTGRTYLECVVIEDIEQARFEAGGMFGRASLRRKDPAVD